MPLSFPSTGGTPGGANTQVQFNNAGAFGGNAGFTYDPTNNRLTIGGATPTTSQPSFNFSQTWNTAGTTYSAGIVNVIPTAHAAGSAVAEWQLSGASSVALVRTLGTGNFAYTGLRLRFGPAGGANTVLLSPLPAFDPQGLAITNEAGTALAGSFRASLMGGDSFNVTNFIVLSNGFYAAARGWDTVGTRIPSDGFYAFSSTTSPTGAIDVAFGRNAAGVVEVNNGTAGVLRDQRLRNQIVSGVVATSAAAPTIASAGTIAPTTRVAFVSGTTTISNITPPSPISLGGGQITLIPTGAFLTDVLGNIALATNAVVNRALIMTYDVTTNKWYPSY